MTKLFVAAMLCALFCAAGVTGGEKSVFDYTLNTIDGQPVPLSAYKGKVVMPVNAAAGAASHRNTVPLKRSMRSARSGAL
jgi:glutathione peroxidase